MPPLDPSAFDSPVTLCPPAMRSDAHRALVLATKEVEAAIENLQRRALELGERAFADQVGSVHGRLVIARLGLAAGPR